MPTVFHTIIFKRKNVKKKTIVFIDMISHVHYFMEHTNYFGFQIWILLLLLYHYLHII